jgi:hypothetical protein
MFIYFREPIFRNFHEDFPDLHAITTGSLLEFAMKKVAGWQG